MPKNNPIELIMDSGATFLYNKYITKRTKGAPGTYIKDKRKIDFSFYDSKLFKNFREAYIKFVLKYDKYLYAYVNMDVINNAEASYESLKYMEERGCRPLPVHHIGCDSKWLQRYVDEGYDFICIGGITPNPYSALKPVLDEIWEEILTDKNRMPKVKVHGLACTAFRLMRRYPWFCVDSATWVKVGAWGGIYVPRTTGGVFDFKKAPIGIQVSEKSSSVNKRYAHITTLPQAEQKHIKRWLDQIGIPLGDEKTPGVINDYQCRMKANLTFYQGFASSLPKWPWPLRFKYRKRLT